MSEGLNNKMTLDDLLRDLDERWAKAGTPREKLMAELIKVVGIPWVEHMKVVLEVTGEEGEKTLTEAEQEQMTDRLNDFLRASAATFAWAFSQMMVNFMYDEEWEESTEAFTNMMRDSILSVASKLKEKKASLAS